MWLECPSISQEVHPGQFVMVRCGEETILRRPLSIHQVEGSRFAVLFVVIGKGLQWLAARQPGEEIDILGSLGNGFTIFPDSSNLLMVAGGIGIAPIFYLADNVVKDGKQVTLLYGTANEERYPVPTGVTEVAATEDGSVGHRGMITELIPQYLERADQVFACGPLPMLREIANMPELKRKSVQVSLEMRMGCGFGVCYSCTIKTGHGLKQVCKDGPVLELSDIIWEEIRI
jgi:dihydroorotate dehydrogenase electron transfer subunit